MGRPRRCALRPSPSSRLLAVLLSVTCARLSLSASSRTPRRRALTPSRAEPTRRRASSSPTPTTSNGPRSSRSSNHIICCELLLVVGGQDSWCGKLDGTAFLEGRASSNGSPTQPENFLFASFFVLSNVVIQPLLSSATCTPRIVSVPHNGWGL